MRILRLNRKFQVSNDFFFRVPKSPTAINTYLDKVKGLKERDNNNQLSGWFFVILLTELSTEFWRLNLSLSYYRVNTIWCVLDPSFIAKAIPFCYR